MIQPRPPPLSQFPPPLLNYRPQSPQMPSEDLCKNCGQVLIDPFGYGPDCMNHGCTNSVTYNSHKKLLQPPYRVSAKRKSPKRKSPKRKSPKRKSPKRKSPKRKSPKRKSPKRK